MQPASIHFFNNQNSKYKAYRLGIECAKEASRIQLTSRRSCYLYIGLYEQALQFYLYSGNNFCIAAAYHHIAHIYAEYLVPARTRNADDLKTRDMFINLAITYYAHAINFYEKYLAETPAPIAEAIETREAAKLHLEHVKIDISILYHLPIKKSLLRTLAADELFNRRPAFSLFQNDINSSSQHPSAADILYAASQVRLRN